MSLLFIRVLDTMHAMAQAVPVETRYTVERYFGLVESGVLHPDDRVELLEGVIVAMSPQSPRRASTTRRISRMLPTPVGGDGCCGEPLLAL